MAVALVTFGGSGSSFAATTSVPSRNASAVISFPGKSCTISTRCGPVIRATIASSLVPA